MAKTIRAQEEAAQYAMSQSGNSRRAYYEALLEDPNVQRGLGVIRATEGTAKGKNPYAVAFGGGTIKDLSRHPGKVHSFTQLNGKSNKTTAAGAYQFLGRTWNGTANKLGLADFGPKNQDIAALALIDQKGGLNHLVSGNLRGFVNKVGGVWASLPTAPASYSQPTKSWNYVQKVWDNGGKAVKGAAKTAWDAVVSLPDQISVPSYRPDIAVASNPNLADRPSMQATLAEGLASPSPQAFAGPSLPASMPAPPERPETYHGAPIGAVQRGGPLAAPSIRDMVANQARFAPEMPNPSRFGGATPPGTSYPGGRSLTAGVSSAMAQEIGPMNAPTSIAMPTTPAGGYARAIGPQELPSQMAAPSISRPGMMALPSQMTAPSLRMEAMLPASMQAPLGRSSFPSLPSQMVAPMSRPALMEAAAQALGFAPVQNLSGAVQSARQQTAQQQSIRGVLESMLGGGGRSSGPSASGGHGGRSSGSGRAGNPNFSDRPSLW